MVTLFRRIQPFRDPFDPWQVIGKQIEDKSQNPPKDPCNLFDKYEKTEKFM